METAGNLETFVMHFALLLSVPDSGKFCGQWFWTFPPCKPVADSYIMTSKLQIVLLYTVQKFWLYLHSQLDEPVFLQTEESFYLYLVTSIIKSLGQMHKCYCWPSNLKCYGCIILSNDKLKNQIVARIHSNMTRLEVFLLLCCCMRKRGFKVNSSVVPANLKLGKTNPC